jgi:hypothetical protein
MSYGAHSQRMILSQDIESFEERCHQLAVGPLFTCLVGPIRQVASFWCELRDSTRACIIVSIVEAGIFAVVRPRQVPHWLTRLAFHHPFSGRLSSLVGSSFRQVSCSAPVSRR